MTKNPKKLDRDPWAKGLGKDTQVGLEALVQSENQLQKETTNIKIRER